MPFGAGARAGSTACAPWHRRHPALGGPLPAKDNMYTAQGSCARTTPQVTEVPIVQREPGRPTRASSGDPLGPHPSTPPGPHGRLIASDLAAPGPGPGRRAMISIPAPNCEWELIHATENPGASPAPVWPRCMRPGASMLALNLQTSGPRAQHTNDATVRTATSHSRRPNTSGRSHPNLNLKRRRQPPPLQAFGATACCCRLSTNPAVLPRTSSTIDIFSTTASGIMIKLMILAVSCYDSSSINFPAI